jgi:hypothetical protein
VAHLTDHDIEQALQPAVDALCALPPLTRLKWAEWLVGQVADNASLPADDARVFLEGLYHYMRGRVRDVETDELPPDHAHD